MHGGAVASLIDTAAMEAAWSVAEHPAEPRGTTVGLTVTYLVAANAEDLQATARALQRRRSLIHLDVEVRGSAGKLVAKGMVTYKNRLADPIARHTVHNMNGMKRRVRRM